jgi:hypothetical protein
MLLKTSVFRDFLHFDHKKTLAGRVCEHGTLDPRRRNGLFLIYPELRLCGAIAFLGGAYDD